MAKHIKASGEIVEVKPKNGKDFKLKELNEFVGGYIEIVYLYNSEIMVVNEEGKIKNLPLNEKATNIVRKNGIIDIIVGNVLLCKQNEIK